MLQFFLNDNYENHCSFFLEEKFRSIEGSLYQCPLEISALLLEIFIKDPLLLITKEFMLNVLCEMLINSHKKLFNNPENDDFQTLLNLLDFMSLIINFEKVKIFDWIPAYDIKISSNFCTEELYSCFFKNEILEILLKKISRRNELLDENNGKATNFVQIKIEETIKTTKEEALIKEKIDENLLKLTMNFLKVLELATCCRYGDAIYKKITDSFPKKKLQELIELCDNNYEYKSILLNLYCNFYIDLKSHLLNKRSNYFSTKPLDLDYDEDSFFDDEYDVTMNMFIKELMNLKDNEENQKELVVYLNNSVFSGIVKLMNFFMLIKDEDIVKITKYVGLLEELNNCLSENRGKINKIYGRIENNQENELIEKDKLLTELDHIDEKFRLKRDKLKISSYPKAIFEKCVSFMNEKQLSYTKAKLISKKSTIYRIDFAKSQLDKLANQMNARKQNLLLPLADLKKEKIKKKNGGFDLLKYLTAFYRHHKMAKMSVESEKNIYIASLREETGEIQLLTYNLCCFIHNRTTSEWFSDKNEEKVILIECLCNSLFIATKAVQINMLKVFKEKKTEKMLFNVWAQLTDFLSFVKFKTNIDIYWKEAYRKVLILIKFHQFLCEDGCTDFKDYFANGKALEKEEESQKLCRIDRWVGLFQKLCDDCQWHKNYERDELLDFEKTNRPHLFPIGRAILDVFTEFCTGPHENIQKKVYLYPYERYNGILHRYTIDQNSEFYKLKLSLIEFMLALTEGMNYDIVSYFTTNFELQQINKVAINSFRQLFYCYIKKKIFKEDQKIGDYPLKMKDYKEIIECFESDQELSQQTLFNICVKLYSLIKLLAENISKYTLFLKEREEALIHYKKKKEILNKSIDEEDLLIYKFMSKILINIEIQRSKYQPIISYYFPINCKCFFLSEESKVNFLKEVDRSSIDSKITGLISYATYFEIEMEYSKKRFKKLKLHKFFGSGLQIYLLEITTFLICLINNLLLLIYFKNDEIEVGFFDKRIAILSLGIIEIVLSALTIISFIYLNYPVHRQVNRIQYQKTYAYKTSLNIFDKIYIDLYQSFFSEKVVIFFYHIFFVCLGLTTTYGFLGIDFFSIISLFPTMQNILKSITLHYSQLLNILLMALVIMFCYSFFVHSHFLQYFDQDFPGETYCSSVSHCFVTIIDKAFRNGEGVGGLLVTAFYGNKDNEGGDARFYGSLFLNLSFYLVINVVTLNLILAVLVDTFSQLRKNSDVFSRNLESLIFIFYLMHSKLK